ncbi:MAG: phage portal protein, partial [Clostridia bacterium]|nr:phage portal protein [Clostridia bacterium]
IAYNSDEKSTLGIKIELNKIPEWENIQEITAIQYIDKPLFSYYKPPIANNIDSESPLGVSVYARAVNLIKEADKQFGRINWEYEASEKAVYVDELATKPTQNKKQSFIVNRLKGRLYKTLNTGNEKTDFFKDYSPEIRDEALWRGLNKTLQRIEFNVGLAYGSISEPSVVDKTATEIKASKQRSYATVSKMQENLQNALEHLIYAMDVLTTLYGLAPQVSYEISFNWDDSLIVDTEKEQVLQMQEVNSGLRSKLKYIMFRYGLTEQQAQEELELINKEKKSNQSAFGFEPTEE